MIKLFLACDFRKEARAVKLLLKNKSISTLAEARGDLIKNPHDYPDYLLRVLLNTVPALAGQIGDPEEFSIADDLIKSVEWEKYARDRQQAM